MWIEAYISWKENNWNPESGERFNVLEKSDWNEDFNMEDYAKQRIEAQKNRDEVEKKDRDLTDSILEKLEREIEAKSTSEFLQLSPEDRLAEVTENGISLNEIKRDKTFKIDFPSEELENQISLADLMPASVRKVKIVLGGEVLEGERRGYNGEFFAENWHRLKIYTGTEVTILENNQEKANQVRSESIKNFEGFTHEERISVAKTKLDTLLEKSLEKGIDPKFVLALLRTENGQNGKDFGVLKDGIDGFGLQLEMALKITARYEGHFKRDYPENEARNGQKFTPEFLAYFSQTYAPEWVSNDPNGLNANHLPNLLKFYFPWDLPKWNSWKDFKLQLEDDVLDWSREFFASNSMEHPEKNINYNALKDLIVSPVFQEFDWETKNLLNALSKFEGQKYNTYIERNGKTQKENPDLPAMDCYTLPFKLAKQFKENPILNELLTYNNSLPSHQRTFTTLINKIDSPFKQKSFSVNEVFNQKGKINLLPWVYLTGLKWGKSGHGGFVIVLENGKNIFYHSGRPVVHGLPLEQYLGKVKHYRKGKLRFLPLNAKAQQNAVASVGKMEKYFPS